MTTETPTFTSVHEAARWALRWLTPVERKDDAPTFDVNTEHPDWVRDLCHSAHEYGEPGDPETVMLPNDWRYYFIGAALQKYEDFQCGPIPTDEDDDEVENAREDLRLAIDDVLPFETYLQLHWLSSNLLRPGYVDEAVEELGHGDGLIDDVVEGMRREAEEVFASVLRSLEAQVSE